MPDRAPSAPAEALAWLRSRVPMTEAAWRALSEAAQKRAFMVAGLAQEALVAQVQAALEAALRDGSTLEDFAAQVGASMETAWLGPTARIETIFRTNIMSAYNAGRYAQANDPDTRATRPYWRFVATLDTRTAPQCRAAHGVILPADHPWWQSHYPPMHHRCRCFVQTLTPRQAERLGGVSAPSTLPAADGFGAPPTL